MLEEAHEVADAIRYGDDSHLKEELGDLLLQVVLHARIAGEDNRFDLNAVAEAISAKLIRRHPRVRRWRSQRQRRCAAAGRPSKRRNAASKSQAPALSDQLAGKVRGQPALAGAMTISKRPAGRMGRHGWGVGQGARRAR